ncbi:hypothetical protein HSBAA_58900 [Vreelandella sulfidaeris]|uniref:CN hydrolase domain-containing protein n=1 Tax=Vreelandella sulfidaeris TaxID=115553 RepID=A0A455UNQ7_9GAMM|nr:hypothetical protein HSBAA_58900 [Halomonas sulfidaeris]
MVRRRRARAGRPHLPNDAKLAAEHRMVIIVPVYEETETGVYYNTAAVFDADGSYLGKYHKTHIPQVAGFWEKFFFKPGQSNWPVFDTAYGKIGVYICYDRHFPEGWRALALNGAEVIFNPSATVAGLSQYLWELEQPASAAANGCFIAAINRVGTEAPWNIGNFYGSSYIVNPRGKIEAQASDTDDELLVHEIDLDMVREVRNNWQFFRDRRPKLTPASPTASSPVNKSGCSKIAGANNELINQGRHRRHPREYLPRRRAVCGR